VSPPPPRVTALREERGGRVRVDLDGAVWRTLPVEVVARASLTPGVELDRPRARTLARELRRRRALDLAGRSLARRDRSRADVAGRLERAGIGATARAETLATLTDVGALDDGRYAASRARSLVERGLGDAAIRWRLENDGVEPSIVDEALAGLQPEPERAARIVAVRGASSATARLLARRGFGEDAVEAALTGGQEV
jgi:regulatory protein